MKPSAKIRSLTALVLFAGGIAFWASHRAPPSAAEVARSREQPPSASAIAPPGPSSVAMSGGPASAEPPRATGTPATDDGDMAQLRAAANDARQAERLAKQGMKQFPASPLSAERHTLLIDALASQQRYAEARGEAEIMVNRYVGSPWAREVEARSGAHPRVNRTYINPPVR